LALTDGNRHHGTVPDVDAQVPATDPAHRSEGRRYLLIAAVMVLSIVGLALVAGYLADDPPVSERQQEGDTAAKPHIIPRPGSGKAPTEPGDRGGWQQTAVFAVMIGGVGTLGVLAWRSGVKARRSTRPTIQNRGTGP
jgi:hypothetical protein